MQNRKKDVCARLTNWLYCLGLVAWAVLGPRVLHAHPAPDHALDDPVWQQAPLVTGFVQRGPEEGQPASVQLASDEVLYVGITAYDSTPEQIVSRLVLAAKAAVGAIFAIREGPPLWPPYPILLESATARRSAPLQSTLAEPN